MKTIPNATKFRLMMKALKWEGMTIEEINTILNELGWTSLYLINDRYFHDALIEVAQNHNSFSANDRTHER